MHNDGRFILRYLESLRNQTRPADMLILVDSGSSDPEYFNALQGYPYPAEVLHQQKDVGFCVGSNIGWRTIRDFEYVIFLNPDAFLAPDFIEQALAYMEAEPSVGMVTPSLTRFDIANQRPLDIVDTTGVVRNWYGNFVERDSGRHVSVLEKYQRPNQIPWLCAAVAFARRHALEDVLAPGDQIFDESFFMYKDDTDLSWRVRRAGWKIMHHPDLRGFHCRGWKDRSKFPRELRLMAARNEVTTCLKNRSPFVILSGLKYLAVRFCDL